MNTFELGRTFCTVGVDTLMKEQADFGEFVLNSLTRYKNSDWGEMCDEDLRLNDRAIKDGDRIFASYINPQSQKKIWIITEPDRSVTTILFPSEY